MLTNQLFWLKNLKRTSIKKMTNIRSIKNQLNSLKGRLTVA